MKQIAFLIIFLMLGACSPTEDGAPEQNNATPKNQVTQNEIWISGWKETSSFNIVRAGAAMVVHNNFVYMVAGVDGRDFLRSTEYAPILSDGGLGEWKMGPPLIEDRGFTEAVVKNGYIYVVGGGNGPNGQQLLTTVERAKINPDGSLGAWRQESNRTILPRRCTKLSLIGDYLYSFGGYGGTLLDSVEYAKIEADGSVGKWKMASEAMTLPRYVNSVKTVGGFAFVLGGHDQDKGVGIVDVEWAKPQANGDIHSWQKTSPLKTGRYGVASAKTDKTIYMLGGLTGLEYLGSIEKSQVLPEGGLAAWQETTAMSVPRATFSAFTNNGYIYVLGGANRDGYLRSVEYAEINAQGDLGFMGSPQEREQYLQQVEAKKNNSPELPNEGVIKQILNAEMYSYIQVLSQGKLVWIAGPKTELPIDARIGYSKGVYMSNFFSKELEKHFPEVTFVSRIEVVQ
ncbi:MAG: hypothetical protein L3J98_01285 [Gammaproteobacteria bacterium]|nr:hypothetical protein [Gammaproteobacteria bacterium]MCF6258788.1 hypothetical protein [Gammaproteobacteria bacterium]